ncbi:hypothetical protein GASC598I20_001790, partial [Gilliamella apicola SCGC AB-598-I20]
SFAIVYRPKLDNNTVDVLTGNFATYDTLDDISFDSFDYCIDLLKVEDIETYVNLVDIERYCLILAKAFSTK